MYLQEIVINPDIFEKISRAFSPGSDEDIDLKSYKENLKSKSILFDKIDDDSSLIYDKIIEILSKSSDSGKDRIDLILKSFLKSDKIRYLSVSKSKKYCRDNLLNQILNLSLSSESRIINSEDKSALLFKFQHEELNDLEMLTFEEFIEPPSESRLYSRKRKIRVAQGKEFIFEDILKCYLVDSENIFINDRYLRNRSRGFMVLKKLLKLCSNLKAVTIHTILINNNIKDNFDMTIEEFSTSLEKDFPNVKIEIKETNKKIGKDRFIHNELFRIEFSPGIDFVNEKNIADKNPVRIDIECISDI